MANRVVVQKGVFHDYIGTGGHGVTGQIKTASWFSRSISINGRNLNRGSLIDFLNTQLPADSKLKKGWFFGFFGGSSDKKIRDTFSRIIQVPAKSNPPNSSPVDMLAHLKQLPEIEESYTYQFAYQTADQIEKLGGICLIPSRDPKEYEGIVVAQENSQWILYLCPGGGNRVFTVDDYSNMMPLVAQELEKRKIKPQAVIENSRHTGISFQNFEAWQKM